MERSSEPISFGKYELLEKIAIGGMAEVFRARLRGEGGFEKHLAIKRILPHLSSDSEFVVMLIDEAKIAVSLAHPNIVQIYDLGKIDGTYFIAMEFIEGGDLKVVLKRTADRGIHIPVAHAVFIASELLKGLEYAHAKTQGPKENPVALNIIHRDISPPNILISYEGEVKIVDFGIAKANTRMMETSAGILKGKFEYMSPEQASGLALDHRTDLFSTALLLYEMLTGHNPFGGPADLLVLQNVRAAKVPPPSRLNPEVPRRLEQILLRALARDKDDRYQKAGEFRAELTSFVYESGFTSNASKLATFMRELFDADVRAGRTASSAAPYERRPPQERQSAGVIHRTPVPTSPPSLELPQPTFQTLSSGPATRIVPFPQEDGPTIAGTLMGLEAEIQTLDGKAAYGQESGLTSLPSGELLRSVLDKSEAEAAPRPGRQLEAAQAPPVAFSFFSNPHADPAGRQVSLEYTFEDDDVATTVQEVDQETLSSDRTSAEGGPRSAVRLSSPPPQANIRPSYEASLLEIDLDPEDAASGISPSPLLTRGRNAGRDDARWNAPGQPATRATLPPPQFLLEPADLPTRVMDDPPPAPTSAPGDFNGARSGSATPANPSRGAGGASSQSGDAAGRGARRGVMSPEAFVTRPMHEPPPPAIRPSPPEPAPFSTRPPNLEPAPFQARPAPAEPPRPAMPDPRASARPTAFEQTYSSRQGMDTSGPPSRASFDPAIPSWPAPTEAWSDPAQNARGGIGPVPELELPMNDWSASPDVGPADGGYGARTVSEPRQSGEQLSYSGRPGAQDSGSFAALSGGRAEAVRAPETVASPLEEEGGVESRGLSRKLSFLIGVLAGIFPGLLVGAYFSAPATPVEKPRADVSPVIAEPQLIIHAESGVEAYLNGNPVGSQFPLTLKVAPNRMNQVRLTKTGFQELEVPIRVGPNESMVLEVPAMVPLKPAPPEREEEP